MYWSGPSFAIGSRTMGERRLGLAALVQSRLRAPHTRGEGASEENKRLSLVSFRGIH